MSTALPPTVTLTRTMDATEFWSAIWGSSPETFGTWWRGLQYLDGANWDTVGRVRVVLEDPDSEDATISCILSLNDLVTAYNDLQGNEGPGGVHRSYLDLEDMDCIGSDAIIQAAVYGEVIFG